MGQVLHGCATTTHAVRTAIQRSKAPLKELAARYGLNHKTVAKWRKRAFVNDAPMGPKTPHSTVLSSKEEAIIVAFRKHTLLPLDDCLYALQATCVSAWNKDPVFGVIGIQSGPRGLRVHTGFHDYGSRGWDADCGDDCEDSPGVFWTGQID